MKTLFADLGATNARLIIEDDDSSLILAEKYKMSDFESIENLISFYLGKNNLTKSVKSAIIGVAAPILDNDIQFVNNNFEFKISQIKKKYFPNNLIVLNDVQLQAYSLNAIKSKNIISVGKIKRSEFGPKILVVPGTGLGLAILNSNEAIATEAGHINIPHYDSNINNLIETFENLNGRVPTFEDLISGKGISFIYGFISQNFNHSLSNRKILENKDEDINCVQTKEVLLKILALFLKYSALIIGSLGGIYLAGSLISSLFKDSDLNQFREMFEDSPTMKVFIKNVPLYILKDKDLAFKGAQELKEIINRH
ncbi:MAG: glucokinase [Pseudomonadota bacterium]|nr:glucokinase [Pseudomonadota bacterium]